MQDIYEINIDFEKMIKIIKKYYLDLGKKVNVRIILVDRNKQKIDENRNCETKIFVYEKVKICGVKSIKKTELNMEDISEILRNIFEKNNEIVLDVTSCAKCKKNISIPEYEYFTIRAKERDMTKKRIKF